MASCDTVQRRGHVVKVLELDDQAQDVETEVLELDDQAQDVETEGRSRCAGLQRRGHAILYKCHSRHTSQFA